MEIFDNKVNSKYKLGYGGSIFSGSGLDCDWPGKVRLVKNLFLINRANNE